VRFPVYVNPYPVLANRPYNAALQIGAASGTCPTRSLWWLVVAAAAGAGAGYYASQKKKKRRAQS
jgi:uncharacterized protein HemX